MPPEYLAELDGQTKRLVREVYAGKVGVTDVELLSLVAQSYSDRVKTAFDVKGNFSTPDAEMLDRLTRDVWHFSGAKNYHNLRDMTLALRDEQGQLREFDSWKEQALQICETYNEKWMRTEYNMAIASSQNAARWVDFQRDARVIPNLRYQTVGDDQVRDSHRVLDGVVKRIGDPFWVTHYPPNGYGCRCEAVQAPGEQETPTSDTPKVGIPSMFRTNLAATGLIFPAKHPFYNGIPPEVKATYSKQVNRNIDRIWVDWIQRHVPEGEHRKALKNIQTGSLSISRKSVKNVLQHIAEADNKYLVNRLLSNTDKMTFLHSKPLDVSKANYKAKAARGVLRYNYYSVVLEGRKFQINTEEYNGFEKLYAFVFEKK